MKREIFSVFFALVLVLSFSLLPAMPVAANGDGAALEVSKWTEYAGNPIFDPEAKAYYPTVVKVSDSDYRMWYGSDSGVGYATSTDGLTWTEISNPVSGLTNANHPLVEYYADGFSGANSGSNPSSNTMYYRIWYWDEGQLYSVAAIRYAESADGVAWYNDQPLQNGAVPIISGGDPWWNRGSYGPCDVLYNPGASNTGTDWVFTMYYDGTTGGDESIGVGFSSDGIIWTGYDSDADGKAGSVLEGSGTGEWDENYVSRCTVIKGDDGTYRMWFSGGTGEMNAGIGYATSSDGLVWTKDANNPIFHKSDGLLWRDERSYCPMVIEDGGTYKMWLSGKDTANGNYAIGYATNPNPDAPYTTIQSAIDAANPGDTVNVAAGTYDEDITINKALTIRSTDGADETIIRGSGVGTSYYMVRIYHSGVTFEGFTVTNPTYEGGADASGILIGAYLGELVDDVRVLNNIVKEVRSGTSGTPSMYGATGINIGRGPLSNVVVSGNTIENIKNPDGASVDHTCGINVWDGAEGVMISNNTISDIKHNGILLQYASNVQVENNPISECKTGIKVEPFEGVTVSDLTVNLNNFGDNFIQLLDGAEALVIEDVLANNTFDRAVTVDHPEASLLYTIWSKIQDGIDAAVSGDTVNVAAGTYVEAITIGKPLTLRGATYNVNKNGYTVPADYAWDDTVESIINHPNPSGGYTTIVDIVDTNDVTFEGFVVQELDAVGNLNSSLLRVYAHTQEISNIVVRNNVIGPNTNTTAQDGTHGRMGLYIVNHPYSDNGVVNSTFSGNKIFDCKGDGNNVFVWSSYYAYGAPGLASMSGTVIEDNEIYGAHRSGIETAGGFSGLTIRNNKIYGNSGLATDDSDMLKYGHGILLIRGASDKLGGPDEALTPEDLTITGNEIYNNEKSGIYMGPINHNYTITGNKIYDNGWDGIRLDLEGTYWNPIFEPEPSDWSCYDGSENIAAHFNNIYDNVGYGVQVIGTPTNGFVLDATNNWWGDKIRGHIQKMVSKNNVGYDPWIGAKAKNSKSKKTAEDDDIVDATTEADTKVVKKGKGKPTITVTEYTDNPGDGAPGGFSSAGKYIDVHIDDPEDVDEIEIRNYYTADDITGLDEASLRLSWWNGTAWIECSNSGVNTADTDGYSGYVWAIIKATGTTPTLADMAGTPFMSMGTPAVAPTPPPVAGGGGGGPPPAPTGTTDVRGMVTTAGVFTRDTSPTSKDGLCTLTIPKGTVGLTEELEPLTEITMLIMDEPPAPPEDAHIVGLAYDFGPDGASFDPAITLTWSYDPADIPEGIAEEDLVIVYYDEDAGRWVDLDCVVDTVNNTITAPVSHFTTFATIGAVPPPPPPPAPAPAAFSALDLSIQPAEVQPKEAVTITVSVANTGGTQESYSVVLMINGVKEVEKSVTVAAGESQDVSFSVTREEAASYSVVVDGLSGSFTVVTPPTPALVPAPAPPPAKPINWPLIGGIIAAVVAGFVIFFLIRRKAA